MATLNPNPTVYQGSDDLEFVRAQRRQQERTEEEEDPIDELEVFDILFLNFLFLKFQENLIISLTKLSHLIRKINDPEHPLTLEQLKVTEFKNVEVKDNKNYVKVLFTPTIPHCSMATLIGLSIRVKLLRSLPQRFKVQRIFFNFFIFQSKIVII